MLITFYLWNYEAIIKKNAVSNSDCNLVDTTQTTELFSEHPQFFIKLLTRLLSRLPGIFFLRDPGHGVDFFEHQVRSKKISLREFLSVVRS